MKKKQKENLIKALQEVNAPDKKYLLERIESKKNFRKEYETETKLIRQRQSGKTSRRVVASACIAGAVVFVVIASLLISSLVIFLNTSDGTVDQGGNTTVEGEKDYRGEWKFELDNSLSFDDIDQTFEEYDRHTALKWLYEYQNGWTVKRTQITQDEKSFREYYTDGECNVEVTVFTKYGKVPALDTRYKTLLNFEKKKSCSFGIVYYGNLSLKNSPYSYGYAIYTEDAVYVLYSDKDLFDGVLK